MGKKSLNMMNSTLKMSSFKNKYSTLSRKSGFRRSSHRMRSFREVKGDEPVLQVFEADKKFSLEIRKRDKQCVNCGSTMFLGCSHYFGRGTYATRYDPYNCITLCQNCHNEWEHEKDGVYKDYMIMWLGEKEFADLQARAQKKRTPYEAILAYMDLSRSVENNGIEY